jgi:transcriptional regulator with XRE-family HTH domain
MNKTVDLKVFAERLSYLIDNSNETTYTLASKLGLTPATISRYTNALMKPKMPTVVSLAQIFGVNEAWLMGYDVDMEKSSDSQEQKITDKQLKFALFGGEVTDEKLNEVKKFAEFIKNKED